MIIPISDDKRITGTEHNWQLERRKIVKDEERWRPYKYFPNARLAVREAVHAEIRQHPAHTIVEALEAVDRVVQKYERLIDGAINQVAERSEAKLKAVS